MPIYEYACMECEDHFDELVRSDDQVITCPSCNATDVLKQISAFAVHGAAAKPSFGGSGGGCCGGGCGCGGGPRAQTQPRPMFLPRSARILKPGTCGSL
jgi:putative FmdB family regulatory protein